MRDDRRFKRRRRARRERSWKLEAGSWELSRWTTTLSVLNAGSSSLKFCVYRRSEVGAWRLEVRGQIEGIGTSPRFAARDGAGARLDAQELDKSAVHDSRTALDSLAAWFRSRYADARVLGVGHRVVHGGAKFSGPTIVTPQILEELRTLVPLAPLHQPVQPRGD